MQKTRVWKKSSGGIGLATSCLVALFLLIGMSSVVGCSLLPKRPVAVGLDPCPAMDKDAIENWVEVYPLLRGPLRLWMGQIIMYCEKVEAQLEGEW